MVPGNTLPRTIPGAGQASGSSHPGREDIPAGNPEACATPPDRCYPAIIRFDCRSPKKMSVEISSTRLQPV